MKRNKLHIACSIVTMMFCSTYALADNHKDVLEGEYVPVSGKANSMEVSRMELGELPSQLGTFKLKLERKDWHLLSKDEKKRIAEEITVEGVFRGAFNMNFAIDHTFLNKNRTGAMYTQNDVLIPTQGDNFCASGVPLAGTEELNFVSGIGEYAALQTGVIYVKGVINNCFGEPEFLQNNFEVESGKGSLIFAPL